MSKVRCMDIPSTRNESKNQQLLTTATSIASLSSQSIKHQTSRLMRILKRNFVKEIRPPTQIQNSNAYNPLCCDCKLHDHFQQNPTESNSKPIEGQINGWSINESEHHEHREHGNTQTHHSQQKVNGHFQPKKPITKHIQ